MVNTTGTKEIELYIEVVGVKLQMNQSVGGHTDLLVRENDNVAEFDYGCEPNSGLVQDTDRCGVYGDDEDCEYEKANCNVPKIAFFVLLFYFIVFYAIIFLFFFLIILFVMLLVLSDINIAK